MTSDGAHQPKPVPPAAGDSAAADHQGGERNEGLRKALQDARGTTSSNMMTGDTFDPLKSVGGVRGLIESSVPMLVFVSMVSFKQPVMHAVAAAAAVWGVAAIARLIAKQTLMPAVVGAIGVAICAVTTRTTGEARGFFLPGLWTNMAYMLVYLISVLPTPAIRALKITKGPWPVLGLMLGPVLGEMFHWRNVPARARAYRLACYPWIGLFAIRLIVKVPLYLTNQVTALGIAHLLLGMPLFLLAGFMSYRILKSVPVATEPEKGPPAPETPDPHNT